MLGDTNKSCLIRPNNLFEPKQIHWKYNEAIWCGTESTYELLFMINYKLSKDVGPQSSTNLEAMWVILFQNDIGSLMYMQHGMHKT